VNLVSCECGAVVDLDGEAACVRVGNELLSMRVSCRCGKDHHVAYESDQTWQLKQALERLGPVRHKTKRFGRLYMQTLDSYTRLHRELQVAEVNHV